MARVVDCYTAILGSNPGGPKDFPLGITSVCNRKIIFLFLNENICCGYSKEPSQLDDSFKHLKHMLRIMGKKIFTISR